MRPRPRPLLVLGFVLIMAALMYVQAPPNPQLSRALKDAAERLKAYYRGNPVPENWKISGVSTGADDVWVDFSLPGGEAAALRIVVISIVLAVAALLASEAAARRLRARIRG